MRLATCNTRCVPQMTWRQVTRTLALLRKLNPDAAGLQEIFVHWYYIAVVRIFAGRGWYFSLPWGPAGVGVLWRARTIKYRGSASRKLSDPVPGVSSARKLRFVTGVVRKTGVRVALGSAHLPPSAWSTRLDKQPALKARTQEAWIDGMDESNRWLTESVGNGYAAALMVDANAGHDRVVSHLPKTIHGQPVRVLTSPAGWKIDHIILVGDWRIGKSGTVKTPSDHAIFYVDAEPAA